MIPAVEVGKHKMGKFGTHHARDVYELFKTLDEEVPVYSSACKVATQYMHTLHFSIKVKRHWEFLTEEQRLEFIKNAFKENRKIV